MQDALDYAINVQFAAAAGDRPTARNVLVILSSQTSFVNPFNPTLLQSNTQLAKDNGIAIFTVGIGPNPNLAELQTISANQLPPSVTFTQQAQFAALSSLAYSTATSICQAATGRTFHESFQYCMSIYGHYCAAISAFQRYDSPLP